MITYQCCRTQSGNRKGVSAWKICYHLLCLYWLA
nr:MAG TPA: hypothetical protein [Caudoviricetes sp.]